MFLFVQDYANDRILEGRPENRSNIGFGAHSKKMNRLVSAVNAVDLVFLIKELAATMGDAVIFMNY